MKKLAKHLLVCDCADCTDMYPPDRFDVTWSVPRPEAAQVGLRKVTGRVPLGHDKARLSFGVWIDEQQRLVHDWPGFPGTAGARVELDPLRGSAIVGTPDPLLGALADPVPLRRKAAERISARCMVELGLADARSGVSDYVQCARHGSGIAALSCAHAQDPTQRIDVVVLYGVDGDFPDVFCEPCLTAYASGDLDVALTLCSRCQQESVYRNRVVATTWYGA